MQNVSGPSLETIVLTSTPMNRPVANAANLVISLINAEGKPHILGTLALRYSLECEPDLGVKIAQRLVKGARGAVITDKLLDSLRQRHGQLWHSVVTQAEWAPVVGQIARVHRSLPELCDVEGRRAYDQAVQVTRAAMDDAVLFCGRFKLNEKIHQSATCVVLKSEDVRGHDSANQNGDDFSADGGGHGGDGGADADADADGGGDGSMGSGGMRGGSKPVVVKLMMNRDQYEREVRQRENLDGSYVMGLVARSDQPELKDRWEKEVGLFNFPDYRYGIVMPAAERNLMVALLQERMNFEVAKIMLRDLAGSLAHMHLKGRIHADLKPLNVVRLVLEGV